MSAETEAQIVGAQQPGDDPKLVWQVSEVVQGGLITFQQVGFSLPARKRGGEPARILKDVSGYFAPGTLTATMGPSGAGKTTFLDIVTGRKKAGSVTGTLLYDGKKATPRFLKDETAYVEQFDNLLSVLTVHDMLLYQAELKCDATEPLASKKRRVAALIDELGLSRAKDVKIGDSLHPGISGGQAKRTNIGIALVTKPRILFLDEPTSGLDSQTSLDVCEILHRLAKKGVTIMSTIHSPTSEAFRLFDSLLLLVKGQTCYFGPLHGAGGAAEYFEKLGIHYNPAENLADFLVRETGDGKEVTVDYGDRWLNGSQYNAVKADTERKLTQAATAARAPFTQTVQRPGPLRAVMVLLRYRTSNNYRFPDFVAPRLAPMVIFGLIVSSLYVGVGGDAKDVANTPARQNVAAVLFMSVALPSFTASGYMPSIVQERPLFYRETADGCYNALTYVIYKLLEEAFPQIFGTLIYSLLTVFICEFEGNFFWHWLIFYVTGQTGIAVAYVCGCVARNMDEANTLLPIYNVTGMFFTGLLFTYEQIPDGWQWYTWTCFVRYAWAAHIVNNFDEECEVPEDHPLFTTPSCPIEYWGIEKGSAGVSVAANFGALCFFWAFFVVLAWLSLAFIRHSSR